MRIELQLTDQMQELIQELGETPRDPGVAKVQRLALRIFNSNVEQATRIRELEAKLEAYERQPADYASRPVSHIDMLSHEQAQDELRYACGALDVAERRERELEAEAERLRASLGTVRLIANNDANYSGHTIACMALADCRRISRDTLAAGEKGE